MSFSMNRLFLLTGLVASSSAALAGPFVGLNVGLSSTGYCGAENNAHESTQFMQTQSMANFSTGYTFSFCRFFAAPFGEIKTLLGNDFSERDGKAISGDRTILGGGLGLGYHFSGFSPYTRIGFRSQRISQIEHRRSIPVAAGGYVTGNFKSSTYVTGLSWSLGADIPVGDALYINVNFATTHQNQKARQMAFAENTPVDASPRNAVKSTPFKRNVSDFTVGVRYAL